MTHFKPQDRVLVSPRHLPGAGTNRLAHAIHPLIRLLGWPNEHERDRTHHRQQPSRAPCS
ncbi:MULTISPECIES: hypothetical protein [Streptomyces]|uniref:Uncharacterized protein n=1 Tax=Streptomyces achromogenes TaxID=67255 RepID=A0ABU0Q8Y7_STRAH|nr:MULTISPECIES: hypothetical protein [Streptomyces]MBP5896580.1 hypothetical protein [Streptomyces sp. LBUM 1481]MDQ0687123.1 hypothetical protein [Streptomyces achromogenes]MDX3119687.1 hypothetical protein [Streptomyces scabiei]MDX3249202.1 hypothetical protein [Streptomyces sp. ME18-1-4]